MEMEHLQVDGRVGGAPGGWWRWSSYEIKVKEVEQLLKDSGEGGDSWSRSLGWQQVEQLEEEGGGRAAMGVQ